MITEEQARGVARVALHAKYPSLALLPDVEVNETEQAYTFAYGDPSGATILDQLIPDTPLLVVNKKSGVASFMRVRL